MKKLKESKKKPSGTAPLYSFRIELKWITPKIWRYFYVPSDISLIHFHLAIQAVMGWENDHLFSFNISGEEYFDEVFTPFHSLADESEFELGNVRLDGLELVKGSRFTYMYDMGDSWDHVIKVLSTDYVPKVPGRRFGCFKGARACPMEDCGGVYGYYHLLDVLADPDHDEHEFRMEWAGGPIDPEAFDLDSINISLSHLE
ncbi:MAG: plasmid pRiA4b ORF-3 family protein [Deltaproteobacteria bacterium]|jgi:hypothetical protein|nr:plasmid pRiA4b ORF-3 family protein [Deltaproteobacteria bacterium]